MIGGEEIGHIHALPSPFGGVLMEQDNKLGAFSSPHGGSSHDWLVLQELAEIALDVALPAQNFSVLYCSWGLDQGV